MKGKSRKGVINYDFAILHKWILNLKIVYLYELYDRIEEKNLKSWSDKSFIGKAFSKLPFIRHLDNNVHHQKLKSQIKLNHKLF